MTSDDIVTVELRVGIIFLTSDDIVIVEWRGGEWKDVLSIRKLKRQISWDLKCQASGLRYDKTVKDSTVAPHNIK